MLSYSLPYIAPGRSTITMPTLAEPACPTVRSRAGMLPAGACSSSTAPSDTASQRTAPLPPPCWTGASWSTQPGQASAPTLPRQRASAPAPELAGGGSAHSRVVTGDSCGPSTHAGARRCDYAAAAAVRTRANPRARAAQSAWPGTENDRA